MIHRNLFMNGASRHSLVLAAGLLAAAAGISETRAVDLSSFTADFESLNASSLTALNNWTIYANVFDDWGTYLYGYGTFPAPNNGEAFCQVTTGEGGPGQGSQGLVIYSDYKNVDHAKGYMVEANTFQEAVVTAADLGPRIFRFDAKKGNIASPSTAMAFIKIIDPANNYALVTARTLDTSNLSVEWGTYSIPFEIESEMVGKLLQFGFSATAASYEPSAVHYDNVFFGIEATIPPVITSITKNGNVVSVTFATEDGASYDLFKSVDGMQTFEPVPTQPTIFGDGSPQVAEDPAATESSAFYRIRKMQ